MNFKKLALFLVIATAAMLSYPLTALGQEIRSVELQSYQIERATLSSLSRTGSPTAQQIEPLTPEKPISGRCTGTFNIKIGDRRAELCPLQYSIQVAGEVDLLIIEFERQEKRNIHVAWAPDRPVEIGRDFWRLREFGSPPEYRSSVAGFTRPTLTTGTWFIAIFNFEEGSPEPYTLTASLSPVLLSSGRPWEGSIIESTVGGRNPAGSCILGGVDYMIDVPSNATSLTIQLRNQGRGDIDLFARHGRPVELSAGRVVADHASQSGGGTEEITITSNSSPPLRSGRYFIAILNCEASRQFFTLTATVGGQPPPPGPVIQAEPSRLTFNTVERGPAPTPQKLKITNAGGGTLNWTAKVLDAPWLKLDSTSGTAPSEILVSVDLTGLAPGKFEGRIIIEAPSATNSPFTIPVTLTIQPLTGQLLALKFIKLEFLDPAAWSRELKEGCVMYKNISSSAAKIRVTLPNENVLEFDVASGREVIVCGDVAHIDTRGIE